MPKKISVQTTVQHGPLRPSTRETSLLALNWRLAKLCRVHSLVYPSLFIRGWKGYSWPLWPSLRAGVWSRSTRAPGKASFRVRARFKPVSSLNLFVEVAEILVVAEATKSWVPEATHHWIHYTAVSKSSGPDAGTADGGIVVYQGDK